MKKYVSVVATIFFSFMICLCTSTESKAETNSSQAVTKEEAKFKAELYLKSISDLSYPNWKDASFSEEKTLYDLDGEIRGYLFQVKKGSQNYGYIIANGIKGRSSIIESTREGENPYKDIPEGQALYTGPLQHLKKENGKIIDIATNQNIEVKKEMQLGNENGKSLSLKFKNRVSTKMTEDEYIEKKLDVPDYTWYKGCTPTAVGNLVAYWSQQGFNDLLKNNETPNQLIENLAILMKTDNGSGERGVPYGTVVTEIAPGVKNYWNSRGYYPETKYDENPTYEKYKKEIDGGRPIIITTVKNKIYDVHSITGVGYEELYIADLNEKYRTIIVHDTWPSTPVDVSLDYDEHLASFHDFITVNPTASGWVTENIYQEENKQVHYNWGNSGPQGKRSDNFFAKFNQSQDLNAGNYFIQTLADDRVRVKVDGKNVIDRWMDSGGQIDRALLTNTKKGFHSIQTEFYENAGLAAIFSDVVPFDSWLAYYYPNIKLEGYPIDAKIIAPQGNDKSLIENSGEKSPTSKVPADNFTAKYTTVKRLPSGEYIIRGQADDAMRVYIDGKLVLDEWNTGNYNKQHEKNIKIEDNTGQGYFVNAKEKDVHLVEVQYLELGGLSNIKFSITAK
ncbi:PA14 domain-containing protein [Bacillus cereus]|nr:PA14 domain-containing protein [Bacillus cereus]